MLRKRRNADTGGHLERMALDQERPLDAQDGVGDLHGTARVGIPNQDAKLIASEPGDQVARVELLPQTRTNLAQ